MTSHAEAGANTVKTNFLAALSTIESNRAAITVKGYKRSILKVGKWIRLAAHRPELVESSGEWTNMPTVPLDPVLTMAFFGALAEVRDISVGATHPIFGKPNKKTRMNNGHVVPGTVQSYKSALVWYTNKRNFKFEEELDAQLNAFVSGYRNIVGALKESGTSHC